MRSLKKLTFATPKELIYLSTGRAVVYGQTVAAAAGRVTVTMGRAEVCAALASAAPLLADAGYSEARKYAKAAAAKRAKDAAEGKTPVDHTVG
eukprot:COSAG01_NODE_513_length_16049_cov_57.758056_12_plen_93_part_00